MGRRPMDVTDLMLRLDSELSELAIEPHRVVEHDRALIAQLDVLGSGRGIARDIAEKAQDRMMLAALIERWRGTRPPTICGSTSIRSGSLNASSTNFPTPSQTSVPVGHRAVGRVPRHIHRATTVATDVVRGWISRHRRRRSVSGHLLLAWSQRGQHRVLPAAFPAHRPAPASRYSLAENSTLGTPLSCMWPTRSPPSFAPNTREQSAGPAGGRVTGAGGRRIVRHRRDRGGVPRDACG